jgi:hypothetical protein
MAADVGRRLYRTYNQIIRTVVRTISHPETWILIERSAQE